jgi:aminoglycoside/choline kinase family phosphotransferase
VVTVPEKGVLLQAGGADRLLPGLAELVASPGASLLSHRPEQRAVVLLERPWGRCYAKVVRPRRLENLITMGQAVRHLIGEAFSVPELLEVDTAAGVTIWSALEGIALGSLVRRAHRAENAHLGEELAQLESAAGPARLAMSHDQLFTAALAAGSVLRTLHNVTPPDSVPPYSAQDQIAEINRWLGWIEALAPQHHRRFDLLSERVSAALAGDGLPPVLLHRDFRDRHVILTDDGHAGLIDFDTLAAGEAALDVANAMVHLELRLLDGGCATHHAEATALGMIEGYQPSRAVQRRLSAYVDALRLWLACLNVFRPPRETAVVSALLDRIGQPIFGLAAAGQVEGMSP